MKIDATKAYHLNVVAGQRIYGGHLGSLAPSRTSTCLEIIILGEHALYYMIWFLNVEKPFVITYFVGF
jgi:hypothetical protein